MEAAGYTPQTDNYYGQFLDEYIFPRAIGDSDDGDKNCYFLANGYMTNLVIDQQGTATDVVTTQLTREAFVTTYPDEAESLFVQTSIEELKKTYAGKYIEDY